MKAINEAESALASKEAELARLKDELYELEQEDPAAEHELDATAYVIALSFMLGDEVLTRLQVASCNVSGARLRTSCGQRRENDEDAHTYVVIMT